MATDPERPSPHDPSLALREQLVFQIRTRGSPWPGVRWDERVLGVVGEVPRHHFAPGVDIAAAYRDTPQPIGFAQTISQPTVVAMMTQALELTGGEKVLEIGTGSGYQAAVLSKLSREVYSIELVETLAERSSAQLAQDGYVNVKVRAGDGYAGWPEHAPFDRIIVTAAPPELPPALVEQLAVGGILVAPVGPEGKLQRLYRYRKTARGLGQEDLGGVFFVPMVESGR